MLKGACARRLSGAAVAAHWITFFSMFTCTLFLGYSSWKAKGPSSKQRYFAGYNEEYNISFYVNLFASISYFGKCLADSMGHNYSDVGFAPLHPKPRVVLSVLSLPVLSVWAR
jgi:hypothetical protein